MSAEDRWPPIVDRSTWDDARGVLLQQEKALTRMKDAVSGLSPIVWWQFPGDPDRPFRVGAGGVIAGRPK
jgi:hypothetical protein